MAQQLKRWESPRRQGRNDKGRGGAARQRQLKKQTQLLRKKLKEQPEAENHEKSKRGKVNFPLFFWNSPAAADFPNRNCYSHLLNYLCK
jgi:hypothetical protein